MWPYGLPYLRRVLDIPSSHRILRQNYFLWRFLTHLAISLWNIFWRFRRKFAIFQRLVCLLGEPIGCNDLCWFCFIQWKNTKFVTSYKDIRQCHRHFLLGRDFECNQTFNSILFGFICGGCGVCKRIALLERSLKIRSGAVKINMNI